MSEFSFSPRAASVSESLAHSGPLLRNFLVHRLGSLLGLVAGGYRSRAVVISCLPFRRPGSELYRFRGAAKSTRSLRPNLSTSNC